MARVIKVKDKKIKKPCKKIIRTGDLVTLKEDTHKAVFLVTGRPDTHIATAICMRDSDGRVVKYSIQHRLVINSYKHYRGKITIKQD